MDTKNRVKKSGFSLMEVLIAIAIVAILGMVTVPIVKRQLEKTDEYAYYMAYKTVEKIAAQIVAKGDPEETKNISTRILQPEDTSLATNVKTFVLAKTENAKVFLTQVSQKLAKSEEYVFHKLFPKAMAACAATEETYNITKTIIDVDSDTYDRLWLGLKVLEDNRNDIEFLTAEYDKVDSSKSTVGCKKPGYASWSKTDVGNNKCKLTFNSFYFGGADGTDERKKYKAPDYEYVKEIVMDESYLSTGISGVVSTIKNKGKDVPSLEDFCNAYSDYLITLPNKQTYEKAFVPQVDEAGTDAGGDEAGGGCTEEIVPDGLNNWVTNGKFKKCTIPSHGGDIPKFQSIKKGTCRITLRKETCVPKLEGDSVTPSLFTWDNSICETLGYKDTYNAAAPRGISCQCNQGYIQASNEPKACCSISGSGNWIPYAYWHTATNKWQCQNCQPGRDFNTKTHGCCPDHSVFDVTSETCKCLEGWGPEGTCNKLVSCPAGKHMSTATNTCVVDPPVLKAQRLCQLLKDNANVTDSYCGIIKSSDSEAVKAKNKAVYDDWYWFGNDIAYSQALATAAMGKNTSEFLTINTVSGAFDNKSNADLPPPHLTFANGQALWILGDREASIPGFTAAPTTFGSAICMNLNKYSQSTCAAATGANGNYFCKKDNLCMGLASSASGLDDARNCCRDFDSSGIGGDVGGDEGRDARRHAISGFTVFVDINGVNKGTNTLWEDIYPFYIAINGTVYPGYPLNAKEDSDSLYIGGNGAHQLAVDVFYYETDKTKGTRSKKTIYSNVSFARGVCEARLVSVRSPYCLNLGTKFKTGQPASVQGNAGHVSKTVMNPCDNRNIGGVYYPAQPCYIQVKRKLKSF